VQFFCLEKRLGRLKEKCGDGKHHVEGEVVSFFATSFQNSWGCGCLSKLVTFGKECALVVKVGLGIQIPVFCSQEQEGS
jgi:hypothetical protein